MARIRRIGVLGTLVLVLAACRFGGPAAQGGACALGGSASDAEFAKSFSAMTLTDAAGAPGAADPDAGVTFAVGTAIVLSADAVAATGIRVCVATRDQAASIVKDVSPAIVVGSNRTDLGTFPAGSYVVRVGAGDVLIRNLPFVIR